MTVVMLSRLWGNPVWSAARDILWKCTVRLKAEEDMLEQWTGIIVPRYPFHYNDYSLAGQLSAEINTRHRRVWSRLPTCWPCKIKSYNRYHITVKLVLCRVDFNLKTFPQSCESSLWTNDVQLLSWANTSFLVLVGFGLMCSWTASRFAAL